MMFIRCPAFLRSHPGFLPLLVAGFMMLIGAAWADRITLANGRVVEGRIVREDADTITVETSNARLPLARSSVVSIERQPTWEIQLREAQSQFRRRDPLRAIELIDQARAGGADPQRITELIDASWSSIQSAVNLAAEPRRREALASALGRLMTHDQLTTEGLLQASRCFFQLEDQDRAAAAIFMMPEEVLAEPGPAREWALDFMRVYIRRLLSRSEFERAIGAIESVRRLTGDAGEEHLPVAHLARAAAARGRGDYAEALHILFNDLEPHAPQIARNRIAITIRLVLERARSSRDWEFARRSLEPIRGSYPIEYRVAINEIVEEEVRELLAAGSLRQASLLLETVPSDQRTADLQQLAVQCHYELEAERLRGGSPVELMRLARWCSENGLYHEAMVILHETRTNASLQELSDELIALARQQRDTGLLEQADRAFREGRLDEAEARLFPILNDPGRASLIEPEARKLADLVRKSRNRERERRPYDAEVLYQRAERAYYLQSLEESMNLIELVLREFADTPAARRAAVLQGDVIRNLEIAFLEGRPVSLSSIRGDVPIERMQQQDKLGEEVARLIQSVAPRQSR